MHSSLEGIEIVGSRVDTLRLGMPSLVRVGLVDSCVRNIQATSGMAVTLETRKSVRLMKRVILGGELETLKLVAKSTG